jgi:phosphate transport system permease protein
MAAVAPAVPAVSLRASGRVRRRKVVNRVMEAIATGAAVLAVGVLALVVASVAVKAAPALTWHFFTRPPSLFGGQGGISSAMVGSALILAMATGMAVPVGVLTAIFLTEFAPRGVSAPIQLVLDMLNGMPTIVTGIFVYGLLVIGHVQSAWAGAFALAVVMLPLVARASQEVLLLVPGTLREASMALGVSRWRTVLGVILPSASGGVLTGTAIAIARVAGETAPLLFTSSIFNYSVSTDVTHALPNLPVLIFEYSEQPDPALHQQAWAASLVLLAFVLVASLAARLLLARSRRKLER